MADPVRVTPHMLQELEARQAWYQYYDTHYVPPDIPRDPDIVYAGKGWKGWCDFLGWSSPKIN